MLSSLVCIARIQRLTGELVVVIGALFSAVSMLCLKTELNNWYSNILRDANLGLLSIPVSQWFISGSRIM